MNVKKGFSILYILKSSKDEDIKIPEIFDIVREVTNDLGYKTKNLSKRDWWIPQGDEGVINVS